MEKIYSHLRKCWYTRKDILLMDQDTIKKLKDQSQIARTDIDTLYISQQ